MSAWLGYLMIPVMNVALVLGVGFVMPRALGGATAPWLVAAAGVLGALLVPAGPGAGALLTPWLVLAIVALVRGVRAGSVLATATAGFALTAALALLASRLEVTLFDIREPIVKLTALHFTYAGAGTLTLARRQATLRPSRSAWLAVALVIIAPPIVAAGFVFRSAVGQVGGATLMTFGVWLVAALQVRDVREGPARGWWLVSSSAPLVAMVLGVAWAANQYWPRSPPSPCPTWYQPTAPSTPSASSPVGSGQRRAVSAGPPDAPRLERTRGGPTVLEPSTFSPLLTLSFSPVWVAVFVETFARDRRVSA